MGRRLLLVMNPGCEVRQGKHLARGACESVQRLAVVSAPGGVQRTWSYGATFAISILRNPLRRTTLGLSQFKRGDVFIVSGFNQQLTQIGAASSRLIWLLTGLLCLGLVTFNPVFAEEASRCLTVEFYYDASQATQTGLLSSVEGLATKVGGITLRAMNIHDAANRKRLEQISKHFALEAKTPALYGCGRAFVALRDETHARQSLDQLRTLTMYGRAGCPRCAAAKEFLKSYGTQFPGLIIKTHDIVSDSAANTELQSLLAAHRTTAASVPVFHLCDQVVVGFLDPASGKARLDGVLEKWSLPCKKKKEETTSPPSKSTRNAAPAILTPAPSLLVSGFLYLEPHPQAQEQEEDPESQAPLPLPEDPLAPLPEEKAGDASASDEIDLPFVGSVRLSSLGLPLFTIAVGLVDGFNPCAMWVLVFLLSVLVNLHNRWKILAVAGTFVFVSGAFYFAFMAAWISVFQFIGMLRGVQITLGVLAVLVGIVHIKDFFAFKKGFSLSIPESAKPGIYARVRRIVTAESLVGAILGAAVLAALVNMVELLCTAGLPALYTQILFSQELATWKNYSYLLLYNLAYMFDDGLMVAVVVITLGHGKMQETHGRWLKLVSGLAVVALGMLMLFKPTWLGM